jgi:hypothetical protein
MPAKSKAQERFMAGVAYGSIKKPGLSKEKAKEFVTPTAGLPERVKPKAGASKKK